MGMLPTVSLVVAISNLTPVFQTQVRATGVRPLFQYPDCCCAVGGVVGIFAEAKPLRFGQINKSRYERSYFDNTFCVFRVLSCLQPRKIKLNRRPREPDTAV